MQTKRKLNSEFMKSARSLLNKICCEARAYQKKKNSSVKVEDDSKASNASSSSFVSILLIDLIMHIIKNDLFELFVFLKY
jgi:hypothetical protein